MKKVDLINSLYKNKIVETKTHAEEIIQFIINKIIETVKEEKDFRFPPVGVFRVKTYKARKARNPKTEERLSIKERKKVKFYPSKTLKNIL